MGLRETLESLSEPDLSGDPGVASRYDAAVDRLFVMVSVWLSPLKRDHSVAMMHERFVLHEPGYHPRVMPLVRLVTMGHPVTLRPEGALVVAAKGRVDISSGKGDARTVRVLLDPMGMTGWCVPGKDGQGFIPLDQIGFLRILDGLSKPEPVPASRPERATSARASIKPAPVTSE